MNSKLKVTELLIANGCRDPGQIMTHLEMHRALSDCETILDVGCGPNSVLAFFGFKKLVGVDGYGRTVDRVRETGTHHEVIQADARKLENHFKPCEFDACVARDVIEHLSKEDGLLMMRSMERISAKKTVFMTPCGFLRQGHFEDDKDLQEHLSGWEVEEMRKLGYCVTGILGPKSLRGEYYMLNRKPKWFWGMISLLGHYLHTRSHPEKAAAILCVKYK